MRMPSKRPTHCKICGGNRSNVGHISWRGRCAHCGDAIVQANITQIREHHGPAFQWWRYRMAASVGGTLVEQRRENG